MEIIFRTIAEVELKEAHDWYEKRQPGLGAEFLRAAEACARLIARHPEVFPQTYRNVRQAVFRRFPYSLMYVITDDFIQVISVFHSSRNPRIWKGRQ